MTPPRPGGPLVILYAVDLVAAQARVEAAGGRIAKPIFDFPAASVSISSTLAATNWPLWNE